MPLVDDARSMVELDRAQFCMPYRLREEETLNVCEVYLWNEIRVTPFALIEKSAALDVYQVNGVFVD